jgi:chromosome segregation ATPase
MPKDNVKNVCCSKSPNYVKQKLVDTMKETTLLKRTVIKLGDDKQKLERENDKFFLDIEEKVKNPKIKLSSQSKKGDQVSKLRDYLAFLEDSTAKCEANVAKLEAEKENMTNKQKTDESEKNELKKKVKDLENAVESGKLMAKSMKEENDRLKAQVKTMSDPKANKKWGTAIVQ